MPFVKQHVFIVRMKPLAPDAVLPAPIVDNRPQAVVIAGERRCRDPRWVCWIGDAETLVASRSSHSRGPRFVKRRSIGRRIGRKNRLEATNHSARRLRIAHGPSAVMMECQTPPPLRDLYFRAYAVAFGPLIVISPSPLLPNCSLGFRVESTSRSRESSSLTPPWRNRSKSFIESPVRCRRILVGDPHTTRPRERWPACQYDRPRQSCGGSIRGYSIPSCSRYVS